jgi:hypothetical protein
MAISDDSQPRFDSPTRYKESHMAGTALSGTSDQPGVAGVTGSSTSFNGVLGVTTADGHAGVAGVCDTGASNGVYGRSKAATGVIGFSEGVGNGVVGDSQGSDGVLGISHHKDHAGVAGVNESGGNGIYGRSKAATGVIGFSEGAGNGVVGDSQGNDGVLGISHHKDHSGVAGVNDSGGIGVLGRGGRLAGLFEGDVEVTGDIRLVNADCAEDFTVRDYEAVEPGTVMVLGSDGLLNESRRPFDKRVAGVISGAGDLKPGIVLDKQQAGRDRLPVALLGKVYCKVDAQYSSIEVGDLLTTSSTAGHAMKATDPLQAFGAVIGKALRPLSRGQDLIPILIALQ